MDLSEPKDGGGGGGQQPAAAKKPVNPADPKTGRARRRTELYSAPIKERGRSKRPLRHTENQRAAAATAAPGSTVTDPALLCGARLIGRGSRGRGPGGSCRMPAGWRTNHPGYGACLFHGGATDASVSQAVRTMVDEAVNTYGLPRQIGPHEALLEEVWRTAGHVAYMEQVVHAMEREQLVSPAIASTGHPAEVSTWVKLYQAERAHLTSVCKTAIDCGIAERQVRLAEEHARVIAGVIAGVLGDFGIAAADDDVRSAVRRHLVAVSAATATAAAAAAPPGATARLLMGGPGGGGAGDDGGGTVQ